MGSVLRRPPACPSPPRPQVDEAKTLREVMTGSDYVVPGVALFFVVAAGTAYREEFLAQKLQR